MPVDENLAQINSSASPVTNEPAAGTSGLKATLLADGFTRKNSQWYLQCLLLLTQFRFIQSLTRLFPSNLEVHFHSAAS